MFKLRAAKCIIPVYVKIGGSVRVPTKQQSYVVYTLAHTTGTHTYAHLTQTLHICIMKQKTL